MAKIDPSFNIKKLRKNVLSNLVDRNRKLEPDTEYWSMQLLIKLGLLPDPEADNVKSKKGKLTGGMTAEEREEKLKDAGLFIPKGAFAAMNLEMEKIAKDNYTKLMNENVNRLSKEEVTTLRKLGLSNDEIAELDPGDNPFKDMGFAHNKDFFSMLD